MAPEYILGQHLTPKVDVYSFGIITLEILSGQKVVTFMSKDQNIYLLNMVRYMQNGTDRDTNTHKNTHTYCLLFPWNVKICYIY